MIITQEYITDTFYVKLAEQGSDQQTVYFNIGTSFWNDLLRQYKIDESKIATPAPYIPARIATLSVLIPMYRDNIGSDYREVREGYTIDVYKAKLDALLAELSTLLAQFTPESCGYTSDTTNDDISRPMITMSLARG